MLCGGRTGISPAANIRCAYANPRLHNAKRALLRPFHNKSPARGGAFSMEQATGIEPASPAWEAGVLPLDYACVTLVLYMKTRRLSMPRAEKSADNFSPENDKRGNARCLKRPTLKSPTFVIWRAIFATARVAHRAR